MEYEPSHFRNYCISDQERLLKYPTLQFFLEQYEAEEAHGVGPKVYLILRILLNLEEKHKELIDMLSEKILDKVCNSSNKGKLEKWIEMLNSLATPKK